MAEGEGRKGKVAFGRVIFERTSDTTRRGTKN